MQPGCLHSLAKPTKFVVDPVTCSHLPRYWNIGPTSRKADSYVTNPKVSFIFQTFNELKKYTDCLTREALTYRWFSDFGSMSPFLGHRYCEGWPQKHVYFIGSCYLVKIQVCMYDLVCPDIHVLYKLWPRPTHKDMFKCEDGRENQNEHLKRFKQIELLSWRQWVTDTYPYVIRVSMNMRLSTFCYGHLYLFKQQSVCTWKDTKLAYFLNYSMPLS